MYQVPNSNIYTVAMSLTVAVFMMIMNEFVKVISLSHHHTVIHSFV